MEIVFASHNAGKLIEIQQLLKSQAIRLLSLTDLDFALSLPENQDSFHGNAYEKAVFVQQHSNSACFAEDSGLEVDALNGAPGVYSARYAGEPSNDSVNIQKLLKNMKGEENRAARFRTVICLLINEQAHYFEGVVNGTITHVLMGNAGFGYDPVFIPEGSKQSFGQMGLAEKNKISHRAQAVAKLADFLNKV